MSKDIVIIRHPVEKLHECVFIYLLWYRHSALLQINSFWNYAVSQIQKREFITIKSKKFSRILISSEYFISKYINSYTGFSLIEKRRHITHLIDININKTAAKMISRLGTVICVCFLIGLFAIDFGSSEKEIPQMTKFKPTMKFQYW